MKPSPLQLESYTFSDIQITAQNDPNVSDSNVLDVKQMFGKDLNNHRRWHVLLIIELNADEGTKPPYLGRFKVEGVFQVLKEWPEDKIEELVSSNATALLYGAIREMTATLTARSKYGSINLSTVRFEPTKIRTKKDINQIPSDSYSSKTTVSQA